jgi:hypothetical protein
MFGFDDYEYDYDNRHYSSSHLSTRSSSRAAISGFRSERSVSARTQEVQEKDFTQIVLGWRLSTVREVDTGARVSQSLERNYTSRTTYYDRFLPLILEDARASVVQGIDKYNQSFSVTIKNDVNAPRDPANPWIMNLEGMIPQDQDHSASMNVLVLSHYTGKERDMVMLVLASEIFDRREIKAKFNLDSRVVDSNPRIFRAGSRWQATYITSLVSHQRMYEACAAKAMPDCLKRIVNGRVTQAPHHYDATVARFTERLNASQQHAVQRFVATPEGAVLLQGPPGTGKTTTIVQMLAALVSKGQRVLVCAPSNKAVQILAERFVEEYQAPVILAGIESKVSDTLRPVFLQTWLSDCYSLLSDVAIKSAATKNEKQFLKALDEALTDVDMAENRINIYFSEINAKYFPQLKECLMALREKTESFDFSQKNALTLFKEQISARLAQLTRRKDRILGALPSGDAIEVALLNRSKVIFSTLSVAGRLQMLDTAVEPVDVLIVDEAGQSVEAETLIAFQHMPNKVLLVGDTKQLPATVISDLAKQKGFSRSMMERLEQNRVPLLRLDTQYRMHADISEWPSNQYYNGDLVTDASVSAHTNAGLAQSIAFYDIHSGKERASGTSRQNDKEADYVVQVIRRLRETDKTSRIGVITFYAAQLNAIQAVLKRETPAVKQKVTVNTVDGFQGDEREIIILSCVCSGGNIGFLNDPRRLNVAITRPKNTLIVLGNARTLEETNSDLKIMIADLRRRTRFFTEKQLDGFLGKTTEAKATATNKGKKAVTTSAGGASATEEDKSAFTSSSTLFNKKVNKSASLSAASDISGLTVAVASISINSKKRPSSAPAASEVTDSTTPKGKTTKQAPCKFFTGASGSCRNGNACKFKHS